MVVVACFARKVGTGVILGGNRAQAERSHILAPRQFGLGQHLRPGEHGRSRKQRRHMAPAIDGGHMKSVGQSIERKGARERNDMPAVHQPPAKAAFCLGECVEVDACRILIEPRRDLDRKSVV